MIYYQYSIFHVTFITCRAFWAKYVSPLIYSLGYIFTFQMSIRFLYACLFVIVPHKDFYTFSGTLRLWYSSLYNSLAP